MSIFVGSSLLSTADFSVVCMLVAKSTFTLDTSSNIMKQICMFFVEFIILLQYITILLLWTSDKIRNYLNILLY